MKVIFTADDYGVHDIIDKAILEAVRNEKINSVAIFPNSSDLPARIEKLIEAVPANVNMQYGCHLTFCTGKPMYRPTPQNFLWRGKYFRPIGKMKRGEEDQSYVERKYVNMEIRTQIAAIEACGVEVSHLSCHFNTLMMFEDYFDEFLKVAAQYKAPNLAYPERELEDRGRRIPIRSPNMIPAPDYKTYQDIAIPGLNKFFIARGNKTRRRYVDWRDVFHERYPQMLDDYNILTSEHTFTDHYGPPGGLKLNEDELHAEVIRKQEALQEFFNQYQDSLEKYEVMIHLIEDNYDKRNIYRKKLKLHKKRRYVDGYSGITAGYVDGRIAEMRSLMQLEYPDHLELVSWAENNE